MEVDTSVQDVSQQHQLPLSKPLITLLLSSAGILVRQFYGTSDPTARSLTICISKMRLFLLGYLSLLATGFVLLPLLVTVSYLSKNRQYG